VRHRKSLLSQVLLCPFKLIMEERLPVEKRPDTNSSLTLLNASTVEFPPITRCEIRQLHGYDSNIRRSHCKEQIAANLWGAQRRIAVRLLTQTGRRVRTGIALNPGLNFDIMANLATFDLKARGREARVRALLDDLVQAHIEGRPMAKMALAVWYHKSPGNEEQFLLELIVVDGFDFKGFDNQRLSLLWKSGSEGQPYANVRVTSVGYFLDLLAGDPAEVARYHEANFEVLYFDKDLLVRGQPDSKLLDLFHIVTDPPGLMKGWYVTEDEHDKSSSPQTLLSRRGSAKPTLGMVKVWESPDLAHSRGILHVQVGGKWVPLSPEGIQAYTYYADAQNGRRVFLIFEGGALYEVLRFEVKTAPEYAGRLGLLENAPDDRYPEVYMRAVPPPARPAS